MDRKLFTAMVQTSNKIYRPLDSHLHAQNSAKNAKFLVEMITLRLHKYAQF